MAKPVESGVGGFVVMASLVPDFRATARQARTTPHPKSIARKTTKTPMPPVKADDTPVSHDAVFVDGATAPEPESVAFNDQPVLSDADAEALAQFEPASAAGEPDKPCDLTPSLTSDLVQNPLTRRGLDQLPDTQRSVANAVMMWDGQWPADTMSGGKALLRALIVKEVSAGRADCLQQVNHGPVFFLVPDSHATVVLAVGSGEWSWGQLVQ